MRVEDLSQWLHGLAHPTRLKIIELLSLHREGLQAGSISEQLSVRSSTLSSHLSILVDCGFVIGDRTGRNIVYRIDPQSIETLLVKLSSKLRS